MVVVQVSCVCVCVCVCVLNFGSLCQGFPLLCEYFNMNDSIKFGIEQVVHR